NSIPATRSGAIPVSADGASNTTPTDRRPKFGVTSTRSKVRYRMRLAIQSPFGSDSGNSSCCGSECRRIERFLPTSCLIGEPLARCSGHGAGGALYVVNPKLRAVVEPKVELREVTVDMLLINVLVDADQPALEDREETFKGVGVRVATDVL